MVNRNKNYLIGLYGVILFWIVLFVAGLAYPDYSQVKMPISMLGNTESPNGWIINYIGLVPLGISIILTAWYMFKSFKGIGFRIGAFLILLGGIGTILVGLFNCHSVFCAPEDSTDNLLHVIGTMMAFLLTPLASLIIGIKGLTTKKYSIFYVLLISCGIGAIISHLLLNGILLNKPFEFGFNQRLIVFFATAIIAVLSILLYKKSQSKYE